MICHRRAAIGLLFLSAAAQAAPSRAKVHVAYPTSFRAVPATRCADGPACEQACGRRDPFACADLAALLEAAVPPDAAQAQSLNERACRAGVARGCAGLARRWAANHESERALPLLDATCSVGEAAACTALGDSGRARSDERRSAR